MFIFVMSLQADKKCILKYIKKSCNRDFTVIHNPYQLVLPFIVLH